MGSALRFLKLISQGLHGCGPLSGVPNSRRRQIRKGVGHPFPEADQTKLSHYQALKFIGTQGTPLSEDYKGQNQGMPSKSNAVQVSVAAQSSRPTVGEVKRLRKIELVVWCPSPSYLFEASMRGQLEENRGLAVRHWQLWHKYPKRT
ncbi:hypothetical protein CEXT_105241 [Caerostris extrusa]|uniref:Uncharacterized protein n=1 Tax=Caerostris extrusa TaxID=172846 RepID=A0AAV4MP03_CAEEX|nr:hypothetical protein CEXT_105241 [Caerostris extrusa]